MWEELSGIIARWEVPWCVGGDVNTVRHLWKVETSLGLILGLGPN